MTIRELHGKVNISKENRTNKSKGNLFRQIIEEKVSRKSEFFRSQEGGPMA